MYNFPTLILKKLAILAHRWTGTAFCLLFSWWFISGVFMMYFDYPEVKESDRLVRAQALNATRIMLSPVEAWSRLEKPGTPDQVTLAMFDGRPVYWFALARSKRAVYADDGQIQSEFPPDVNLRTAVRWTGGTAAAAKVEPMKSADQWTVGGLHSRYAPLTKYSWPNGDQVYVSGVTGEVVQYTTRASRLGAWLGPIPHWLYFTPLRRKPRLWSRIVIWLSGVATLVAILGLIAGISMYSPAKRYRSGGTPTSIPYAGPKRLHMILGLFFGVLACTWAFSGMLSMDPFPVKTADNPDVASQIADALGGQPFAFEAFAPKHPREVLARLGSNVQVKQLDLLFIAGAPCYLATQDSGQSRLIPVTGEPETALDQDRLVEIVTSASRPFEVAEARWINDYDAYYLDRHRELPLPVLRVRIKDPQRTTLYIDPRSARIVGSYNSAMWAERWLYHGLHSINLPWLYKHRPAWDIAVLLLMLGGTSLCLTSVIIGWRLLRRNTVLRV